MVSQWTGRVIRERHEEGRWGERGGEGEGERGEMGAGV